MCLFPENKLVQISLARLPFSHSSHLHVAPSSSDQKKSREKLGKVSEKSEVSDGNFLQRCVFMPYVFRLSSSSTHWRKRHRPKTILGRQSERKLFHSFVVAGFNFETQFKARGIVVWKIFVRTCARFFTEIRAILVITFSRKIMSPISYLQFKWPAQR